MTRLHPRPRTRGVLSTPRLLWGVLSKCGSARPDFYSCFAPGNLALQCHSADSGSEWAVGRRAAVTGSEPAGVPLHQAPQVGLWWGVRGRGSGVQVGGWAPQPHGLWGI